MLKSLGKHLEIVLPKNWPIWSFRSVRTKVKKTRFNIQTPKIAAEFQIDKPLQKKRFFKKILLALIVVFFLITLAYYLNKSSYVALYVVPLISEVKERVFLFGKKEESLSRLPVENIEERLSAELKNILTLQNIEKLDKNTIQVTSRENLKALFNPDKDISIQINSLQTILTRSRIEKKSIKKIDLRFSKIAIEYN